MKDFLCLTPRLLTHAKEKMVVMHPLPRVNEIRFVVVSIVHFYFLWFDFGTFGLLSKFPSFIFWACVLFLLRKMYCSNVECSVNFDDA